LNGAEVSKPLSFPRASKLLPWNASLSVMKKKGRPL